MPDQRIRQGVRGRYDTTVIARSQKRLQITLEETSVTTRCAHTAQIAVIGPATHGGRVNTKTLSSFAQRQPTRLIGGDREFSPVHKATKTV
jgi:hypothetical protein